MFFYLCKVLFSGFLEFRGNFVDGRNNSKYRDVAPLRIGLGGPADYEYGVESLKRKHHVRTILICSDCGQMKSRT